MTYFVAVATWAAFLIIASWALATGAVSIADLNPLP